MTLGEFPKGIRLRLLIACMLAAGALILFAAKKAAEKTPPRRSESVPKVHAAAREIDAVIDTLFARYKIQKMWVKAWRVQTPNKELLRLERRVFVPPEFLSLTFNFELNRLVAQYGARTVASERRDESTVTMHIIKDRVIIVSIALVVRHDLKPPG